MFEHSVKVPRIYKISAQLLREVKEKRASLKQLIYEKKHTNLKGIFALVAKTLEHISQIDTVIEKSNLLVKESRFDPWLARVLVMELVWNEKQLQNQSKPIKTISSYYETLKKHKQALDSNVKQRSEKKVKKSRFIRFIRINTLAVTVEEAINGFREEDWTLMPSTTSYNDYLSKISCLGPGEFMIDLHIKELLLFPSNTEFYNHYAYKQGMIILQDKASCLPTHLLNPPPGSVVLDMCAAPGMKTTHLAALLNNEGVVYAVEKDKQRFSTLDKIVQGAGATCVKTINNDVLKVSADDCPNVEYILVDPSCSGSGIMNRIEIEDEPVEVNLGRLKKLANFQVVILKHALMHFPQAKRIVYSTCSIYPEENENVIRQVEGLNGFKLISARDLLNGPWRDSESQHDDAIISKCLYTTPEKDLTNGFFIAVFERDSLNQPDRSENPEKDLDVMNERVKSKRAKRAIKEENEATTSDEAAQSNVIENKDEYNTLSIKKELKKKKAKAIEEENKTFIAAEHTLKEIEGNSNNISGRKKHKEKKGNAIKEGNERTTTEKIDEIHLREETSSKKECKKKKRKAIEEENKEATTADKTNENNLMEEEDNNSICTKKKHKKNKKERVKENNKITTTDEHNLMEVEDSSSSICGKKEHKKKKRDGIKEEDENATIGEVDEADPIKVEDNSYNVCIEKQSKKKRKHAIETSHKNIVKEKLEKSIVDFEEPHDTQNSIGDYLLPKVKNKKKKRENKEEMHMKVENQDSNTVIQTVIRDEKVEGSKKSKKHKKRNHETQADELSVYEQTVEYEHKLKKEKKVRKISV